MATINRENIGTLNDRITVQVSREDYFPGFEKALKKYTKDVNLPGFRKGMVPTGLVKKMHGQSLFTQEVIRVVEKELNDYLRTEKPELVSDPLPEEMENIRLDVNNPGEYDFHFEIGLKPDVDLSDFDKKFHFTRYKVMVEDKDIDEEVERLQKRAGERKDKEEITSGEDILHLRFQPSDAEGKVEEGAEVKSEQIVLSYFKEDKRQELMGNKPGDTRVIKLPDVFEQKELDWITDQWKLEAAKAGEQFYLLTIDKIEEIIPMELTEEFFQKIYPGSELKTPEDFRDRVRQDDKAYWEGEAGKRLDNDIFETLVHQIPLELPESFLKKLMKRQEGETPSDEAVEQNYPELEHSMRWRFISGKIAQDNNLQVSPEELRDNFRGRLMQYFGNNIGQEGMSEKLEELVNTMMQNEKSVNEAYSQLSNDKIFTWLRDKADTEEKEITADEFLKLPHNHHHHEH
jgi:trigger factor